MPDVFVSSAASMQAAINVVLLLIYAESHDAVLLNAVQDGQFVPNMCANSPRSLIYECPDRPRQHLWPAELYN